MVRRVLHHHETSARKVIRNRKQLPPKCLKV
jgi:hypothetical protein